MSFSIFCYAIMSIRLHNLHRHTRLPVFSLGKHQCLQQTGRGTGNHSHFIQQRTQQYMATHTSLNFLSSPSIMLFMKFLTKRTSPYLIISFLSPVRERGMRWTDGKTWSQSWNFLSELWSLHVRRNVGKEERPCDFSPPTAKQGWCDVLRWELLLRVGRSVNVCSMEFVCIEEVFCVLTCAWACSELWKIKHKTRGIV